MVGTSDQNQCVQKEKIKILICIYKNKEGLAATFLAARAPPAQVFQDAGVPPLVPGLWVLAARKCGYPPLFLYLFI